MSPIQPTNAKRYESATGGQKEAKDAELFTAPPDALLELAKVYSYGAHKKYAPHNYRLGYPWSYIYNALFRHVLASMKGEDEDPESGLLHMAHAAWHCLALVQFLIDQREGRHPKEFDDRFRPTTPIKWQDNYKPLYPHTTGDAREEFLQELYAESASDMKERLARVDSVP